MFKRRLHNVSRCFIGELFGILHQLTLEVYLSKSLSATGRLLSMPDDILQSPGSGLIPGEYDNEEQSVSGETETNVSGWTTDTLKYYVDAAYAARDKANDERFVGQERATIDAFAASEKAIKDAFSAEEKVIQAFHDLMDDRDIRYQQRYESQENAIKAAITAHDIRQDERFANVKERFENLHTRMTERDKFISDLAHEREKQVNAAFNAQATAVQKAEAANEKRFESVNEFRQQLNDQAHTFLPRKEYEVQHAPLVDQLSKMTADTMPRGEVRVVLEGITNRVDTMTGQIANLNTTIASLRASLSGQSQGGDEVRVAVDRTRNILFATAGTLIALMGFTLTLILAFH